MIELFMVQVTVLFSKYLVKKYENKSIASSQLGSFIGPNTVFEPSDAESSDSELKRYYSTKVENESLAQELIVKLLKSSDVEAAWIRPRDAPPS